MSIEVGLLTARSDDGASISIIEILDRRWALTILSAFSSGPQRFNALARSTKVNPNTLAERLRDFEDAGIIERVVLSDFPPRVEYRVRAGAERLIEMVKMLSTFKL